MSNLPEVDRHTTLGDCAIDVLRKMNRNVIQWGDTALVELIYEVYFYNVNIRTQVMTKSYHHSEKINLLQLLDRDTRFKKVHKKDNRPWYYVLLGDFTHYPSYGLYKEYQRRIKEEESVLLFGQEGRS